jgi:hypothetical protein
MMPLPSGTGDEGQRYAVEVLVEEQEGRFTPGWHSMAYTNVLESAQAIAESFVLRPNWLRSRVIDRGRPASNHPRAIGKEYIKKQ